MSNSESLVSQSNNRFAQDKSREEILASFLSNKIYPVVTSNHTRITDPGIQKRGGDVRFSAPWTGSMIADEKAQISDRWINDPAPTFAMEIFSESWRDSTGNIEARKGWFINEKTITDYYILVWLPNVSLFKLTHDNGHYMLQYNSRTSSNVALTELCDQISGVDVVQACEKSDEYKLSFDSTLVIESRKNIESIQSITFSDDVVSVFRSVNDPLPEMFCGTTVPQLGTWCFDVENIHEAKITFVKKQKIRNLLQDIGLTNKHLMRKGFQSIDKRDVIPESDMVSRIMCCNGSNSGAAVGEDPVTVVIRYEAYNEIADKQVHYIDGKVTESDGLFENI